MSPRFMTVSPAESFTSGIVGCDGQARIKVFGARAAGSG
jgi:hypothetical protein